MRHLSTHEAGDVRVLVLDRPPANAMDVELLDELARVLEQMSAAPPPALVIAGRAGFFSGGADLKAVPGYGPEEQRLMVSGINRMAIAAYGLPCPAVAAVTGHAIAGGMVLALCFDYRVAATAGRYGLTEVRVGVPYPQAAIAVVRAELSPLAARRLALGSALTDAADCVRLGCFDEALSPELVLERAVAIAAELATMPADVYARTKLDLRSETLVAMKRGAEQDPLLS